MTRRRRLVWTLALLTPLTAISQPLVIGLVSMGYYHRTVHLAVVPAATFLLTIGGAIMAARLVGAHPRRLVRVGVRVLLVATVVACGGGCVLSLEWALGIGS